jgi:hypothetical protein
MAMNPEWARLYFRVIAEGIRQEVGKEQHARRTSDP